MKEEKKSTRKRNVDVLFTYEERVKSIEKERKRILIIIINNKKEKKMNITLLFFFCWLTIMWQIYFMS